MEPCGDERDLVIKVKYGDTLRRISAYVNEHHMDLNMSKLRGKIISLFKFSPDANFLLTYTDEDGDVVTLDDDDELRDAVISQRLSPLRINVKLISDTADARPEAADPAVAKSPQLEAQTLDISSAIDDALNSVPEPFRDVLSNLSNDMLKAVTSAPAFAQVVGYFSKLGLTDASQTSPGSASESLGRSNGASTHKHLMDLNISDEPKASTDANLSATVLPRTVTSSVNPAAQQHECRDLMQGAEAAASTSDDLNILFPKSPNASGYPLNDLLTSIWTPDSNLEFCKEGVDAFHDGKPFACPFPPSFPGTSQNFDHNSQNCVRFTPLIPTSKDGIAGMSSESSNRQCPVDSQVPLPSQTGLNPQADAQINSQVGAPPDLSPIRFGPVMHPYRRSRSHHENMPRTFHRGVQCDGCGMHPIVGPRFKSKVKEDYDLCNICFFQMGNEADYTRIDRAAFRGPRLFKEFYNPHPGCRIPILNGSHGGGGRPLKAKLESRFIQDITVLDGTMMPPLTRFTKIWRMRNNGNVAWPFGTQLLWVGGDQFGDRNSTDLEISVNGFPVGEELDIAVDFTAPPMPGRYVSYWRMASPSGHKFGQRVWVLIQVECSQQNAASGSSSHPDLNLNLPPESDNHNGLGIIDVNSEPLSVQRGLGIIGVNGEPQNAKKGLGIIDVNAEPLDASFSELNVSLTTEEVAKPSVGSEKRGVVEQPAEPAYGMLGTSNNGQKKPNPAAVLSPSSSYNLMDLITSPFDPYPASEVTDGNPVEQALLKELEMMGFRQTDLNKEILRLNKYNLEQSVNDLCGYAEWDPLLSELQEMGFSDKTLNKKLLVKNSGSLKRVVLDLIAGEKGE